MWEWPVYLGASGGILYSGFRLCKETDALAVRWGWTRSWAGLILLATITSLPELFTGLSSVTIADTPRIALADVAGSLAFNMLAIGVLAIVVRRRLFQVAATGHLAAATQAGMLTLLALGMCFAGPSLAPASQGALFLLLPVLYGIAMWSLHRKGAIPKPEETTKSGSLAKLAFHGSLIVAAAGILPYAGAAIADGTGLGRTFVGGLFVAVSTSLPEVAVTVAAWRIGAPDLALGNLIGSNLFDLAILGIDEAVYGGALIAQVEAGHQALIAAAVVMTGLVWLGLRFPQRVSGRWIGACILLLYVAAQAGSLAAS